MTNTMNVFHVNCRNARSLGILLAIVICVYITLNVIYIVTFESFPMGGPVTLEDEHPIPRDPKSVDGRLKFGRPDANGKVEVVVSLDVKQLLQLLGNRELEGLMVRENGKKAVDMLPLNISYVLHNPTVCQDVTASDMLFIVGINSAPENYLQRSLLRETWASAGLFKKNVSRTIFLLGQSTDPDVQSKIQAEFDSYHDIVQGNFIDVTRNATLKGIMALHFIAQYCSHAKYYIKAIDDTFLNIFEIIRELELNSAHKRSVICPLWKDNTMPILRDPKDCMQWCVTPDELPGRTHFPQYCAGLAFIMSQELIPALYQASLRTPYFWIDDVYITGILMLDASVKQPEIRYVDLLSNFTLVEADAVADYTDTKKPLKYSIAKIHDTEVFRKVWRALIQRLPPTQFKLLSNSAMSSIDVAV